MKHVDRMIQELIETGKTHTVVRWGRWPGYYEKDYTDEVIKAIGGGDYQAGKTLVTVGNDAPRGGILGTFVELPAENLERIALTIKAPVCKMSGKDLLGTIKVAFVSFSPYRPKTGKIFFKREAKENDWEMPTESRVISLDTARAILKQYFEKGAQIHVCQNAVVD